MSEELERLARRALACVAWRWVDGMAAVGPWRVLTVAEDGYPMSMFATAHHHPRGWWGLAGQPGAAREVVPDLADAATLGCLVRTAVGLLDAIDAAGGSTSTRRASLAAAVADYITGASDSITLASAIVAAIEAASEVAP